MERSVTSASCLWIVCKQLYLSAPFKPLTKVQTDSSSHWDCCRSTLSQWHPLTPRPPRSCLRAASQTSPGMSMKEKHEEYEENGTFLLWPTNFWTGFCFWAL